MFDVKRFLSELGFKPEQVDEMAPKFESGHVSALEARYADPARVKKLQELEGLERQLAERNDQFNLELAEWAKLSNDEKAASTKLRSELEASQAEVLRLTQAVTRVSTQAGIDPTTVLPKAESAPAKREESAAPSFNPSDFVSARDHSAIARFNMELPSKLLRISREHHALTGEDLDTDTIIAEIQKNAGRQGGIVDPVAIWERQHDIPAKRQARETERRQNEIKEAEHRGYERARTDQALTPTAIPGRHSGIFQQRNDQGQFVPRQSALKRPQPETAVRGAASALATGKYKPQAAQKVG